MNKVYLPKREDISTSKFAHKEKELIKSKIASLTIKKVPDLEIAHVIFNQTGKTINIGDNFV